MTRQTNGFVPERLAAGKFAGGCPRRGSPRGIRESALDPSFFQPAFGVGNRYFGTGPEGKIEPRAGVPGAPLGVLQLDGDDVAVARVGCKGLTGIQLLFLVMIRTVDFN
jgi:hypothetical protein